MYQPAELPPELIPEPKPLGETIEDLGNSALMGSKGNLVLIEGGEAGSPVEERGLSRVENQLSDTEFTKTREKSKELPTDTFPAQVAKLLEEHAGDQITLLELARLASPENEQHAV